MSFYDWCILKYDGKDTPRGDLAYDMKRDKGFPRSSEDRDELLTYIENRRACRECVSIFKRMFLSYKKEVN